MNFFYQHGVFSDEQVVGFSSVLVYKNFRSLQEVGHSSHELQIEIYATCEKEVF